MGDQTAAAIPFAIDLIRGTIHEANAIDRRSPIELPIDCRLREDVVAAVQARPDGAYAAVLSTTDGLSLGLLIAAWPTELNDYGVAFVLNHWLLILRSGNRSRFGLSVENVGGLTHIKLSTEYNGFSFLMLPYFPGTPFWEEARLGDETRPQLGVEPIATSNAPVLATEDTYYLAIADQAMAFVKRLRQRVDLPLEAAFAAASEASLLYLVATMQEARRLDLHTIPPIDSYVDEGCGWCIGALISSFQIDSDMEDFGDDDMDRRIDEMSERLPKRVTEYADYEVRMPIEPQSDLAHRFAVRVRAEVSGTPVVEDATLAAVDSLGDLNPRGHLQARFNR